MGTVDKSTSRIINTLLTLGKNMAAKKQEVSEKLAKAFEAVEPKNPALSGADKAYLRGLKRRGFTESEIREVAQKAGFVVPVDLFQKKEKEN